MPLHPTGCMCLLLYSLQVPTDKVDNEDNRQNGIVKYFPSKALMAFIICLKIRMHPVPKGLNNWLMDGIIEITERC